MIKNLLKQSFLSLLFLIISTIAYAQILKNHDSIHASELKGSRFANEERNDIDFKKIKDEVFYFNAGDDIPLLFDTKTSIVSNHSVLKLVVEKKTYFRFFISQRAIESQESNGKIKIDVPEDFDLLISFDRKEWVSFFNMEQIEKFITQDLKSVFNFSFKMTPERGFYIKFKLRMPQNFE